MDGVYRQNDWLCYTAISHHLSSKKCFHPDPTSLRLSGTGKTLAPPARSPPLSLLHRCRWPPHGSGGLGLQRRRGECSRWTRRVARLFSAAALCGATSDLRWRGPGGARRKDDEARLIARAERCFRRGCGSGFTRHGCGWGFTHRGRAGGSGGWGGGPRTQVLVVLWPPATAARAAWWLTRRRPVLLTEARNGACGAELGAAAAVQGGGLGMDPVPLCPDLLLGFGGGLSRVRCSVVVSKVLLHAGHRRTRVAWWCWPLGLPDLVSG
jgi:hypothetical protein